MLGAGEALREAKSSAFNSALLPPLGTSATRMAPPCGPRREAGGAAQPEQRRSHPSLPTELDREGTVQTRVSMCEIQSRSTQYSVHCSCSFERSSLLYIAENSGLGLLWLSPSPFLLGHECRLALDNTDAWWHRTLQRRGADPPYRNALAHEHIWFDRCASRDCITKVSEF